jgi:hypothetical protein
VAVGVIAEQTSFTTAFLVVAAVSVVVLPLAILRESRIPSGRA